MDKSISQIGNVRRLRATQKNLRTRCQQLALYVQTLVERAEAVRSKAVTPEEDAERSATTA